MMYSKSIDLLLLKIQLCISLATNNNTKNAQQKDAFESKYGFDTNFFKLILRKTRGEKLHYCTYYCLTYQK